MTQPSLPGTRHISYANRGMGFESELMATHAWYLTQRIIDVVKNPNEWVYCGAKDFEKQIARNPGSVAKDGSGRFMRRVRSDVDFAGGNGHISIVFDAKETSAERWPFSSIEDHQVLRLQQSKQCGSTSGIFIKFVKHDRVFWLGSPTLSAVFNKWMVASYGRRRAKPGEASLAISQLEEMGIEIFRHPSNRLWDWYEKLKN